MSDESTKKKWWKRRWVVWCVWMPLGLFGLLYGVFAWLGWRERKLWDETLAQIEQWGERVDLADFMPAEASDEENVLADNWFLDLINRAETGVGLSAIIFGIEDADKGLSQISYLSKTWGDANPNRGLLLKVAQDEDNDQIAPMSNADRAKYLLNALDANFEVAERLNDVLSRPAWHSKIQDDPLEFFDANQHYLMTIELSRFYAKEAMMRGMVNDVGGACRSLDSLMRVLAIAKTHQLLIGQLVEITCEGVAQVAVWQLLATFDGNPKLLDKLDDVICLFDSTGDSIIEALRAETAYGITAIKAAHENGMTASDYGLWVPSLLDRVAANLVETDFVAYRTMRMIVELRSFEIRRFEEMTPCPPINHLGLMLDDAVVKRLASQGVTAKLIEGMGIHLAEGTGIFVSNQANVVANTLIGKSQVAAARFKLSEGRYPIGFSELVPNYLDSVPSDPFDGKPLRWTKDESGKPLIYSIGPDLIDDGGVALDDDKQGDIRWLMTVQGVNDASGFLLDE